MKDWTFVLFSGSRTASPAMLDYTQSMVQKAIDKDYLIFVGDNPEGVDYEVLQYIRGQAYRNYSVIAPSTDPTEYFEPRSICKLKGVPYAGPRYDRAAYTKRDQEMARYAHKGIFLWNGVSPGTIMLHKYMTENLEKETHLINFKSGKPVVQSFVPLFA